jgi:hypothetical protein
MSITKKCIAGYGVFLMMTTTRTRFLQVIAFLRKTTGLQRQGGKSMIDCVKLGKDVMAVLEILGGDVTIMVQNRETNVRSFTKIRGCKMFRDDEAISIFTPHEATFYIPYRTITHFITHKDLRRLDIAYDWRNTLSIREL